MVERLRALNLHCILVDDGSHAACAAVLDTVARSTPEVTLVRRAANGGKGAAMQDGFRRAADLGYTHALQVDADGQHDLRDAQKMLQVAQSEPDGLVNGQPIYGDDAPRSRLYGRWLTTFWVRVNTLSCDIPDAMCGFRVYPLRHVLPVLMGTGDHMEFDIAILVRMHWAGVAMFWVPTRVSYPDTGISHFRGWADNLLISRMHARLFFGMLVRAPRLLWRRLRSAV